MKYGNLHLHTVYSDGILLPGELCARAKEMGYGAVAITDHFTVRGHESFAAAAEAAGLEYLLGIECYGENGGHNHHIVGYHVDQTEPAFAKYLQDNEEWSYRAMKVRFDGMVAADAVEGLTWQEVLDDTPGLCWICNEQIFASLIKRRGWKQEDYYTRFMPAFKTADPKIPNTPAQRTAEQIIRMIRNAGGIASLAHPHGQTHQLPDLYRMGLNCVEYDHPDIDGYDAAQARLFAESHRMYLSGGTDHTGPQLADAPHLRCAVPNGPKYGKGILTPMHIDVRCGVTKEEFDALKNRIYE